MRYIEVLPKDKCLKIAKIVGHDFGSDEDNLLCLPDQIFEKKFIVDYEAENYVVYDNTNQSCQ